MNWIVAAETNKGGKLFKGVFYFLWKEKKILLLNDYLNIFLQRNESELEGMAVASVVGDDSTNPASPNPEENDGKEASGKKKKNRCLNCKKKVGLTGRKKIICI